MAIFGGISDRFCSNLYPCFVDVVKQQFVEKKIKDWCRPCFKRSFTFRPPFRSAEQMKEAVRILHLLFSVNDVKADYVNGTCHSNRASHP